jgi:hypothetical protein
MYFQTVEVEVYTSNTFEKLIYSSWGKINLL